MYYYKKTIDVPFDIAVEKIKGSLAQGGFGILTEINVKEILKKKLNVDREDYLILGACNPSMAHKALQAEQNLGVMLPCNVVVYEKDGKTTIAAIRPTVQMAKIGNKKLEPIALEVEKMLRSAVDKVA